MSASDRPPLQPDAPTGQVKFAKSRRDAGLSVQSVLMIGVPGRHALSSVHDDDGCNRVLRSNRRRNALCRLQT
jgi:hypothetical protein